MSEKQLCQWCGHSIPSRRRDTGFCSWKCAINQEQADKASAASEREAQADAGEREPSYADAFPRRNRMDRWTPAERAIYDATQVVESAGADVRLTNAVILLGKAQALVADFVDGVPLGEGYPRDSVPLPGTI